MNNADRPAMPVPGLHHDDDFNGLTIREEFAKAAMLGYISAGSNGMPSPQEIVALSIKTADALLAELERTGGQS